mgnify:CR=1 FL=1
MGGGAFERGLPACSLYNYFIQFSLIQDKKIPPPRKKSGVKLHYGERIVMRLRQLAAIRALITLGSDHRDFQARWRDHRTREY